MPGVVVIVKDEISRHLNCLLFSTAVALNNPVTHVSNSRMRTVYGTRLGDLKESCFLLFSN